MNRFEKHTKFCLLVYLKRNTTPTDRSTQNNAVIPFRPEASPSLLQLCNTMQRRVNKFWYNYTWKLSTPAQLGNPERTCSSIQTFFRPIPHKGASSQPSFMPHTVDSIIIIFPPILCMAVNPVQAKRERQSPRVKLQVFFNFKWLPLAQARLKREKSLDDSQESFEQVKKVRWERIKSRQGLPRINESRLESPGHRELPSRKVTESRREKTRAHESVKPNKKKKMLRDSQEKFVWAGSNSIGAHKSRPGRTNFSLSKNDNLNCCQVSFLFGPGLTEVSIYLRAQW